MAETESVEKRIAELKARYQAQLREAPLNIKFKKSDFAKPDKGTLKDILNQRYDQRKWLFWFAISFSGFSFIGLVVMLASQGTYAIYNDGDQLFGTVELSTVGVGVFLQFLGLLKIITDSLWNDKPYLDSGELKNKDS